MVGFYTNSLGLKELMKRLLQLNKPNGRNKKK